MTIACAAESPTLGDLLVRSKALGVFAREVAPAGTSWSPGTTGMGGDAGYTEVELAQLKMENFTAYPAFNGNVAVVDTKPFWFPVNQSPADEGYHWNRNAKSYYNVGQSMAQEMKSLVEGGGEDNIPPSPNPMAWASVPVALGGGSITMTATSASDGSGVDANVALNPIVGLAREDLRAIVQDIAAARGVAAF